MKTTIYLIRHGEVFNPEKILYGRLPNFGLSEKGKKEIEQTAEFLANKHIDAIYSSPLERAKQTAEIINTKLHLSEIHFSEKIIEVRTSYQGRKMSELDDLQSEQYLKPLSPNDETIKQIADRMFSFIQKVLIENIGKHIVICSHGDPIMSLQAAINHLPFTLPSIGKGGTIKYSQHGEVYEIIADGENLSIQSVFKPTL